MLDAFCLSDDVKLWAEALWLFTLNTTIATIRDATRPVMTSVRFAFVVVNFGIALLFWFMTYNS
jgi:hypothetical protein